MRRIAVSLVVRARFARATHAVSQQVSLAAARVGRASVVAGAGVGCVGVGLVVRARLGRVTRAVGQRVLLAAARTGGTGLGVGVSYAGVVARGTRTVVGGRAPIDVATIAVTDAVTVATNGAVTGAVVSGGACVSACWVGALGCVVEAMFAGLVEEFFGEPGIGDDADRIRPPGLHRAGVTERLQGVGDTGNRRVVPDHGT
jgi:hypothetical protein